MKSENTIYRVGVVDKVDIVVIFKSNLLLYIAINMSTYIGISILIGGHKVDTIQRNLLCPPHLLLMPTFLLFIFIYRWTKLII